MTLAHEKAVCLVFLIKGFDDAHRGNEKTITPYQRSIYEDHADEHNGYIGVVSDFYEHACWLEDYLDACWDTQDFPGVFHYEVTEELGAWLFYHPEATRQTFAEHARRVIDDWFAAGLATYLDPVGSVDHVPAVPAAPDTPVQLDPTLPPTQPKVSTPRTTKVPMKLQALIKALKVVRDSTDDGRNLDVVIRGSKPKGIADVAQLKLAKNSKRGNFVVIDKISADSDD